MRGLRGRRMFKAVEAALWAAARNEDGLLCDFSVQNDHLHLVIDAANSRAMRSAVRGLAIRVAKAINSLCGRKGRVFDDRYHARVLRTPTEVRRVRHYVRDNFRKHLRERLQTERTQDLAAWLALGSIIARCCARFCKVVRGSIRVRRRPCAPTVGPGRQGAVGCCQRVHRG